MSSGNPDVLWLIRRLKGETAATPAQDDANIDIASIACSTQGEASLLGLLDKEVLCEGEDKAGKRKLAIDVSDSDAARCHVTYERSELDGECDALDVEAEVITEGGAPEGAAYHEETADKEDGDTKRHSK